LGNETGGWEERNKGNKEIRRAGKAVDWVSSEEGMVGAFIRGGGMEKGRYREVGSGEGWRF